MKKTALFLVLACLLLTALSGQEALKSMQEDYFDFLSVIGVTERPTIGYRTLSDSVWLIPEDAGHVWKNNSLGTSTTLFEKENPSSNFFLDGIHQSVTFRLYGPEWYNSYNKSVPYGQNDGALWQGVGLNSSFTTGIRFEAYGFEATFKPQLSFSENKDWDYLTGPHGPYSYFAAYTSRNESIDLVQRYGDSPFYTFSWGDSEIRWSWNTFTVGFGTQSPWLGTSYLNPMLGSNNADPYPKFDFGIRKTPLVIPGVNWNLGDIEARVWLGRLTNSGYYETPNQDKDRMTCMGSFSYNPSFIDGLSFGINRLFMTYWQKENLSYMFRLFDFRHENATGSGNDEDQKASLFVDWLFPQARFEVYGELGIDDFTSHIFSNPFHTGIYTIGIKQAISHTDTVYGLINMEWNTFEMSQDFQLQWNYGGYYFHGFVSQGYTNNGQIVGAGTGALGNSQFISYTLFYPKGNTVFKAQRYCPDNNYILNKAVNGKARDADVKSSYAMYETYLTGGFNSTYFITPQFSLSGGATGIMRSMPKYSMENGKLRFSLSANFGLKYIF